MCYFYLVGNIYADEIVSAAYHGADLTDKEELQTKKIDPLINYENRIKLTRAKCQFLDYKYI